MIWLLKSLTISLFIFLASPFLWAGNFCQSFQFNPEKVQAFGDEVKVMIQEQSQLDMELARYGQNIRRQNQRVLQTGDGELQPISEEIIAAEERMAVRRQNNCFDNVLVDKLITSIESCNFFSVSNFCRESYQRIESQISSTEQRLVDNRRLRRESSRLCGLVEFKNELIGLLGADDGVVSQFRSCREQITNNILVPSCLNAYDQVFDPGMKGLLARNCTAENVDSAISNFISYMNSPEGPTSTACNIMNTYVASRQKAAQGGVVLSSVDEDLNRLAERLLPAEENGQSRSPASFCSEAKPEVQSEGS
jgi:hypothetical protein